MISDNSQNIERKNKINLLEQKGLSPFLSSFKRSASIAECLADFTEGKKVSLAGRVMAKRLHGKANFIDIKDGSAKIQFYIREDQMDEESFWLFSQIIDIGDFVGATGELFKTRTGEPTIKVTSLKLLSKSLNVLPEKWHGLKDVEIRYRQRYLDLISNDEVKKIFIMRSKIIIKIREFFDSRGFIEVETPMMQPIPGGAVGKPFKTHHNALNLDLYLRIAPELYLKRLIVGGLDKVYEINKNFRNEGISTRHSPEFTMLETYTAYADYNDMMNICEELLIFLAQNILGKMEISYQGRTMDLRRPWKRVSFAKLLKDNYDINPEDSTEEFINKLKKKGKALPVLDRIKGTLSRSQILNIITELFEPESLNMPVFLVDWFAETCPLAKRRKDNPFLAERFELFLGGLEIGNAYSELNDPIEQRKRFEEELNELAPDEMHRLDDDYIKTLEYGMPPTGGLGIGIDRLVMLFTDVASIREVILFPLLKPQED
ncbi:MAG: lysine--tRNA ligase [Candidatus Omnitrophota bacterium]